MKPNLKEYLRENNISYSEFGARFKPPISRQRVEHIVNGKSRLTFETAIRIWEATGYNVSLASLYYNLEGIDGSLKKYSGVAE